MEAFLNFLSQNLFGVLIGAIGIVLGIIGITSTIKSRTRASLSYQDHSLQLIEKSKQLLPKNIEILFDGKPVTRLTKTYMTLWNSGNTTLYGNNIVAEDPLRLEFSKDAQILQAPVIKSNRDANKFISTIRANSPNIVDFNFDYLDPEDGVVVEILHTDIELHPKIQGTIRGIRKGVKYCGYIASYSISRTISGYKLLRRLFNLFYILIGAMSIIIGLNALIPTKAVKSLLLWPYRSQGSLGWFLIIMGTLFIALILVELWFSRRHFPKSLAMRDM